MSHCRRANPSPQGSPLSRSRRARIGATVSALPITKRVCWRWTRTPLSRGPTPMHFYGCQICTPRVLVYSRLWARPIQYSPARRWTSAGNHLATPFVADAGFTSAVLYDVRAVTVHVIRRGREARAIAADHRLQCLVQKAVVGVEPG